MSPQQKKELGGIINVTVFADIMDHFKKEEGPNGRWKEWSEAYQDHLVRIGRIGNLKLQFNGKLRQSFTVKSFKPVSDGILFFNAAKTKKGFAYAEAHDEGGRVPGRPPARPFMWLSKKAVQKIGGIVVKWLKEF